MKRFWVSWWSGYYEDEGCTEPPFQVWTTGQRFREDINNPFNTDTERSDVSLCAVIDAPEEVFILPVIYKHFPDCEMRFCEQKRIDWQPGDRFQDFEGRTSLNG